MMDDSATLQVWRSSHESSRAANATFEAISMSSQEFAFESMVHQPPKLMPGKQQVSGVHELTNASESETERKRCRDRGRGGGGEMYSTRRST